MIDPTKCPSCGSANVTIGGPVAPHHGSLCCHACGHHRWLPKPGNEGQRRKSSLGLARKFGRGYCEFCGRSEAALPAPEVLDGHHVTSVEDGGTDERDNIWIVCSSCHSLIHHQRTYLGHYR